MERNLKIWSWKISKSSSKKKEPTYRSRSYYGGSYYGGSYYGGDNYYPYGGGSYYGGTFQKDEAPFKNEKEEPTEEADVIESTELDDSWNDILYDLGVPVNPLTAIIAETFEKERNFKYYNLLFDDYCLYQIFIMTAHILSLYLKFGKYLSLNSFLKLTDMNKLAISYRGELSRKIVSDYLDFIGNGLTCVEVEELYDLVVLDILCSYGELYPSCTDAIKLNMISDLKDIEGYLSLTNESEDNATILESKFSEYEDIFNGDDNLKIFFGTKKQLAV